MTVSIKKELLDNLFPANFFLDKELKITSCGPSFVRHFGEIAPGTALFDRFEMTGGNDRSFFDLPITQSRAIYLTDIERAERLAGTVVPIDSGYFMAVRLVPTEAAFRDHKYQISEFPPGDSTVQGLMLINLQRAMIEESQDTALELAFERQRGMELLDRVNRIAGYMAHDFNNFLSIIKLNCDRLSREYGSDERLERLVSIIRETAVRGSSITGSLMKLSHQRTDTQMPIAVDQLIEENAAFLRTVVGANVALSTRLEACDARAIISHVRLMNCLTNLLINARDAMPEGGEIVISTRIEMLAIEPGKAVPTVPKREFITIEVADNGRGMTEAVLSRAFEPLFSTKTHGNGFGLASALEYAREMGGDARLESAPGKGSKVFLYLPTITATQVERQNETDNGAPTASSKGRILLVEDEPYALEALVEMLEAEDYHVTACETGDEALRANEHETFDVLLTDIIMPGRRGTELARLACEHNPALKIILMSGYVPDPSDISPGWMFVRKPMDSAQLLSMIEAAIAPGS